MLRTSVSQLNRVGKTVAERLSYLGIETVEDLIFYFPFRYDDFRLMTPIAQLRTGSVVTVQARLNHITSRRGFRTVKHITEALVGDETGEVGVMWFNQPFLENTFHVGEQLSLSGKVSYSRQGLVLMNPSYERIMNSNVAPIHTAGIVPVYSVTANITQKQIRFLIRQALDMASSEVEDFLPQEVIDQHALLPLREALEKIHFPHDFQESTRAQRRLKFDELFFLQMQNALMKHERKQYPAPSLPIKTPQLQQFVRTLPFTLTDDQRKCAWQALQDMEKSHPMNRLLQGDVGSGKTVICAMLVKNTIENGYQAALMAPTEILAQQHYLTFLQLYGNEHRVTLITGSVCKSNFAMDEQAIQNKKQRREIILEKLSAGSIDIVIGTHALIEDEVQFKNLALIIVDEQHRFGVRQRKALKDKMAGRDLYPHMLSMTATPIPRTLALTLYGELNISTIHEMPKGRKTVVTRLAEGKQRGEVYNFIRTAIKNGRQCYVICPLIEESDALGVISVKEEYAKLVKIFPEFRLALLHGKLRPQEKEEIMRAFKNNEIPLLISTSVVEVGVDVPNATVMMIEGAERFGLSQLHQFRGRVGRSDIESHCFVFAEHASRQSWSRLKIFESCHDGFLLAKKDMELRGPGEFFGQRQSGLPEFKIASVFDNDLINETAETAQQLIAKDPLLSQYPLLKLKVDARLEKVHLS